jgi:ATP-dependent Clp protease protease subunit
MVIKKKKDKNNVNENVNVENKEVIELDPEALEALIGGCSPVAQSFNYTWLDSFDMEDLDERRLYINDIIDDEIIMDIGYHILRYNRLDKDIKQEERKPITLYINTDGGGLYSANSLISLIENSVTPVHTVNLGRCFSAGFLIFIAGKKRYTLDNGIFLLHDGQNGDINATGKYFDKASFEKNVIEKKVKDYVLEKTAITPKMYDKNYRVEWYMSAEKAMELNVCDYIVGDNCTLNDIL